jgi:transketolase
MTKYTFTEKKDTRSGFGVGLHELGKSNPNIVALTADLTGSLKMDAFKKDFPERFFQVGKNTIHRNVRQLFNGPGV